MERSIIISHEILHIAVELTDLVASINEVFPMLSSSNVAVLTAAESANNWPYSH